MTSFYVAEGPDHVRATVLTRGPWDPSVQHGGPPAALLLGAMEALGEQPQAFGTSRVTMELLRPIPIDRVGVSASIRRAGRRVIWLEASLSHDGQEVARATAVRVRHTALELPPPRCPPLPAMPPPAECEPLVFAFFEGDQGYHTAVECRVAEGVWGEGPAAMWIRARHPLVEGRDLSPVQRVMLAADASNGVCPVLDTRAWAFINPDLTVHVHRPPAGEWIGLRARSTADPAGTGLVDAEIHDEQGEVGRALLSLVVGPRSR